MSKVSVFTPDKIAITVSSDTVLLNQLEENGIRPTAHCRNGFCGCCRTKLISGKVEYIAEKLGYTKEDEILPCICKATSDIEIEV